MMPLQARHLISLKKVWLGGTSVKERVQAVGRGVAVVPPGVAVGAGEVGVFVGADVDVAAEVAVASAVLPGLGVRVGVTVGSHTIVTKFSASV
jgi:hypothetical protein